MCPAKYFKCPDGQKVGIRQCLEKCHQTDGRCLSLPTLTEISNTRPWTGKPSTTQLINPTRIEFLKIQNGFTIDPFDRAFALLGTRHHQLLDAAAKKLDLISEKKIDAEISGIIDLLEPDELHPDQYKLVDYKTWGAYAIARFLGIKGNGEEGWEAKYQLNKYRIELERLGFSISRMFVQCTVRDGGTQLAKRAGIDFKLKLILVEQISDDIITAFFARKNALLLTALAKNELPPFCNYEERWGNRRCLAFCDVKEFCPEGRQMR